MAYNPTNWQNLPNTTTPLYNVNFNKIESELNKLETDNGENIGMQFIQGGCWIKLGTITFDAQGQSAIIECMTGEGSNGSGHQNTIFQIMLKQGWSGNTYPIGFSVNFLQNYVDGYKFKIKHLSDNIAEIYIYLPFAYNDFTYSITGVYSSFVRDFEVLNSEPTGDKNATVYVADNGEYSTSETRIGTWIDGKPLYRKVVNFGTLPNSTSKSVSHNISNMDLLVDARAIASDAHNRIPLPFLSSTSSYMIEFFIYDNNIIISTGSDRTGLSANVTLEYTKTTDD